MQYLSDIATIRSGYLFREKIDPAAHGGLRVVQVSDITPDARLARDQLVRVHLPDVKPNQLLVPGDCLFISRGPRKQAIALTEAMENTIATSQFFVIRLNPLAAVSPDYLAWYINQRPAQRYIGTHSRGSTVSLLSLDALKKLPIEAPPAETQQRIVRVAELSLREGELLRAIREKRRALVERTLLEAVSPRA
jgi:restriction endonuclease S subunit